MSSIYGSGGGAGNSTRSRWIKEHIELESQDYSQQDWDDYDEEDEEDIEYDYDHTSNGHEVSSWVHQDQQREEALQDGPRKDADDYDCFEPLDNGAYHGNNDDDDDDVDDDDLTSSEHSAPTTTAARRSNSSSSDSLDGSVQGGSAGHLLPRVVSLDELLTHYLRTDRKNDKARKKLLQLAAAPPSPPEPVPETQAVGQFSLEALMEEAWRVIDGMPDHSVHRQVGWKDDWGCCVPVTAPRPALLQRSSSHSSLAPSACSTGTFAHDGRQDTTECWVRTVQALLEQEGHACKLSVCHVGPFPMCFMDLVCAQYEMVMKMGWFPRRWKMDENNDDDDDDNDDDEREHRYTVFLIPIVTASKYADRETWDSINSLDSAIRDVLEDLSPDEQDEDEGRSFGSFKRLHKALQSYAAFSRQMMALQPKFEEALCREAKRVFGAEKQRRRANHGQWLQKALAAQRRKFLVSPEPQQQHQDDVVVLPRTTVSLSRFGIYQQTEPFRKAETLRRNLVQVWQQEQQAPLSSPTLQRCWERPPEPRHGGVDAGQCIWCTGTFSCPEEPYGETRMFLSECTHSGCPDCWFEEFHNSGSGLVRCPHCPTLLQLEDVIAILIQGSVHLEEVYAGEDDEDFTFLMDLGDGSETMELMERMIRFHIEASALFFSDVGETDEERMQPTEVRHCTTPSCDCAYFPKVPVKNGDSEERGKPQICLCSCGATHCCGCNGPAHLGLSCSRFAIVQKALDRISGKVKDMEWLMFHTRPCPTCKYPIEKNGGCFHMRCETCGYYFCWECGGPGGDCDPFECHGTDKLWFEKLTSTDDKDKKEGEDDEAKEDALKQKNTSSGLVCNYRYYLAAERKLREVRTTLNDDENVSEADMPELMMELQLQQLLVWLYAVALLDSAESSDVGDDVDPIKKRKSAKIAQDIKRVELIIHARKIRKVAHFLGGTVDDVIENSFLLDDAVQALEGDVPLQVPPQSQQKGATTATSKTPTKRSTPSKRKEQARQRIALQRSLKEQHSSGLSAPRNDEEEDTFEVMMADEDLAELCEMDSEKFAAASWSTIVRSIRDLTTNDQQRSVSFANLPSSATTGPNTGRKQGRRAKRGSATASAAGRLNVKSPPVFPSWKMGKASGGPGKASRKSKKAERKQRRYEQSQQQQQQRKQKDVEEGKNGDNDGSDGAEVAVRSSWKKDKARQRELRNRALERSEC